MPFLPVPLTGRVCDTLRSVAIVALLMPPFLLVVVACVPAVALLPFLPGGSERAVRMVRQLADWSRSLPMTAGGRATRRPA